MRTAFVLPLVVAALGLSSVAMSSVSAAAGAIDGPASASVPATRLNNQRSTADPTPPPAPATAQYRVTVTSEWTATSHPTTRPGNSHFSPTVMTTHSEPGALFVRGAVASPGIEAMAETGATGTLRVELAANPAVTNTQTGTSIFGVGTNTFTVELSQDASLVSLVTMLAPSPDWFVGVRDVELFADDAWLDRVDLSLANYDAGTDSGALFTSGNFDTSPAQVISGPRDASFIAAAAEGRFGAVTIERI